MSEAQPSPFDRHIAASIELMSARLMFHRSAPSMSYEDYVGAQRAALAESLSGKHIIYLDTNAWKCLSDFVLGKQSLTAAMKAFCEAITCDAIQQRCVFPMGISTLFELESMNDPDTQKILTHLVDQYARNICLFTQFEVVPEEFHHFANDRAPLTLPHGQRFCRSVELFTFFRPTAPKDLGPADLETVYLKAIYDVLTALPLSSQLEMARSSGQSPWDNNAGIESMNEGKKAHQARIVNFIDGLYVELAGVLQLAVPERPRIAGWTQPNHWSLEALTHWKDHPQSQQLITARIMANLHAVMRFTENRVFKKGDIADFATAATALPVCHALFTDQRLVRIAQDKNSEIPKFNSCELVYGFDRFAEYLRTKV